MQLQIPARRENREPHAHQALVIFLTERRSDTIGTRIVNEYK